MEKMVTVVTATTGSKYLKQCIESVQDQTYKNIQHLIFVDGIEHKEKFDNIFETVSLKNNIDVIYLPYSVGSDRYNGHRMYGSSFYFCKGEFVSFLDDDNWFDSDHIESTVISLDENSWGYSLRKIIGSDGTYICNDDCESLGEYPSILNENDYFVDQNCYMIPKKIGLQLSPLFYRKFREPGEVELDRVLIDVLRRNNIKSICNGKYSVNYRAGNTQNSVTAEFFLRGNEAMLNKYAGKLPWRK